MQLPNEIQCDLHIPMEKEQNINKSEMKVKLSKNTFITKLYAGGLGSFFFFFFVHEMKVV